ncbi:MAG TPA: glycosyl hydrolase [Thermoanaerobaculia bacterium]
MAPRQRYRVAFFALGWLVAISLLLQSRFETTVRVAYNSVAGGLGRVGQFLSDREANVWLGGGRRARRRALAPLRALLRSPSRLRNPDQMLFGAYDGSFPSTFSGLEEFERTLDYRFPIISFYQAWGDRPEHLFPTRMVETIERLGSVPMITWEPWVTEFDSAVRTHLPAQPQREYASLAAIARGDYNFYARAWAEAAAEHGGPIFLRFAHEMNDPYRYPWGPQNGNRPEDFIAAWRQMRTIFQQANANNVIWVWSPHVSMPWFEFYYPGDEWVDWIGCGALNYGDVAAWSRWWSFEQIFEKAYPTLARFKKPIVIAEFGTIESGGDPAEWYAEAFGALQTKYSGVRAVVFFHQRRDTTVTKTPLDWSFVDEPRAVKVVREVVNPQPGDSGR